MFYFNQKVTLKSTNQELVFKGEKAGILYFTQNGQPIQLCAAQISKSDFTEIWETVKLFGKTPIKRLARAY